MNISEQVEKQRAQVEELSSAFERAAEDGLGHATVLNISKSSVTVVSNRGTMEVGMPTGLGLRLGDSVLTWPSGQIHSKHDSLPIGQIISVGRVIDEAYLEVSIDNRDQRIIRGANLGDIEEGDKVLLDSMLRCAVSKIAKENDFLPENVEVVSWDDIGGQTQAKKELREAVEMPYKHPELFAFYKKRVTKGIMLYGPPGCGKTMLGKAVANSLTEAGQQAGFIYVKGPEVLNMYVGASESNIRNLFRQARAHKKKHGSPAVIFIDEADALLGTRGHQHAHMEKTIVPTFLAEMDGVSQSDAIVILATNRPDILDPAIVRDGRIDRKVQVTRPAEDEVKMIFALYLDKVPLSGAANSDRMAVAEECAAMVFAPSRILYEMVFEDGQTNVCLSHFVSGAMVNGIVDKAISLAINRDIESRTQTGVMIQDLRKAVQQTQEENSHVNHEETLKIIANGRNVVSLRKV